MVDDKGRPIKPLSDSSEYRRLKRERDLKRKAEILKSAILDVTRTNWNASIDSLNTRDLLDNIEIKGNGSIWYKDKIVYKKVGEKYILSRDKRSVKYILEFRQQIQDINTDSLEKLSSDNQKIEQLITVNTINGNFLSDVPVEISVKPRIKGIIDNALNFNPTESEPSETAINELENAIKDIKDELNRTDSEDMEIRKYYRRLVDYLENKVDILRKRSGLSTKYNN